MFVGDKGPYPIYEVVEQNSLNNEPMDYFVLTDMLFDKHLEFVPVAQYDTHASSFGYGYDSFYSFISIKLNII